MRQDELAYYRAVEDHFARLRGTAFLFTPKDFGLLRRWWGEAVPLAAVIAGIGEVAARRSERGEDPVSSLAYCRHAVARHAKRLAAAAVGGDAGAGAADVPALLAAYVEAVRAAAGRWSDEAPVAAALTDLAAAVETLPTDAPAAALEVTAASLEATALEAAAAAFSTELKRQAEAETAAVLQGPAGAAEIAGNARRAIAIKVLRALLGVPRLELAGDASEG
jgi:hypothetical protein